MIARVSWPASLAATTLVAGPVAAAPWSAPPLDLRGASPPPAESAAATAAETGDAKQGPASGNTNGPTSDEVSWLRAVLSTPGADAATRLGAAQRLLRLSLPESPLSVAAAAAIRDALRDALRSGDEALASAVIDAIRGLDQTSSSRLPRSLAAALVDAARDTPPPRRDPLRAAFARLGQDAVATIAEVAADGQSDESRRLAAVWALEAIGDRRAAESLVGLLAPRPAAAGPSDTAVRTAACDSLERLFQRGFGRDEARWREWWTNEGGGRPDDSVVEGLRRRVLDLERRMSEQEQEKARLEARLAALYGEIYLALDPAQRQDRTVKLLADELPSVREYALGLVDRMLRNFESLGEPIQGAILARLDPEKEPRPALRSRAIRLLDSIGRPDLPELASPFFALEQDPEVLATYLAVFQRNPATSDAAFDRAVALLDDSVLGPDAARAIVRLGDVGALDAARMARLRPIADRMSMSSATPELVRLAGAVAEDAVLDRIETLLQSEDRAMRRAAADVMRQRGRREALARFAGDEAVYPVAIRAAADPPATLEGLRRILSWEPPSTAAAADRAEVIGRLCEALPVTDLAEADSLLASSGWADEPYRTKLLERVIQPAAEGSGATGADAPASVLVRLGMLLIGSGDLRALQTVVDRIGSSSEPGAEELRFATAVVQQQYDAAERLRPAAPDWLSLLERLIDRGSPAAAPLLDEMRRRFRTRLSDDEIARLDQASDALRARSAPRTLRRRGDEDRRQPPDQLPGFASRWSEVGGVAGAEAASA